MVRALSRTNGDHGYCVADVTRGSCSVGPLAEARSGARADSDNQQMSSLASKAKPRRVRRAAAWLLSVAAGNAEGAVYGTVMVGVLFAAEDARRVGYWETIEAAALVLVLYWLTAFYTYNLGGRLQMRESVNPWTVWRSCVHELPLIEGAVIPVVVLLVAWAAGASVTGGVTLAVWATAVTIVVLEVAAGWRARLRPRACGFRPPPARSWGWRSSG
jgi:hypothetical protein